MGLMPRETVLTDSPVQPSSIRSTAAGGIRKMKAGPDAIFNSPLPWTGDFEDGLGNLISMLAYANPEDPTDEQKLPMDLARQDSTSSSER